MNAKVNLKNRDIHDRYTYLTARERERDHTYVIITEQKVPFKIHEMEKHEKKKKNQNTILYVTLFILLSLLW